MYVLKSKEEVNQKFGGLLTSLHI